MLSHAPRLKLCGRQNLGRLAAKGIGDTEQVEYGHIPFAPFDFSHMPAVHPGDVSQIFLRDAGFPS